MVSSSPVQNVIQSLFLWEFSDGLILQRLQPYEQWTMKAWEGHPFLLSLETVAYVSFRKIFMIKWCQVLVLFFFFFFPSLQDAKNKTFRDKANLQDQYSSAFGELPVFLMAATCVDSWSCLHHWSLWPVDVFFDVIGGTTSAAKFEQTPLVIWWILLN